MYKSIALMRLRILPERELAKLLRTPLFEYISRLDRREAVAIIRSKGTPEVYYFLSKDIED